MIQINLLPDVKSKYIKAERTKRTVLLSSLIASGVSIGLLVLLSTYVYGAQKLQLSSLDKDIKSNSQKLKNIDSLDKILTIQNQLSSLPSLHSQKPVTSRLFVFLPQITPSDVQLSSLDLSNDGTTIEISGTAKSVAVVNKFVDTLKFTDYKKDNSQDTSRAFSKVVLSSFSTGDKEVSYTISMNYDSTIFSGDYKTVTLVVPKITSTRSQTEQPSSDLFKSQTNESSQ